MKNHQQEHQMKFIESKDKIDGLIRKTAAMIPRRGKITSV